MESKASTPGRRDRNMQEKRDRIFRAAADLFAERGFEAVTTREISDRADVAAGTLFRYATSKSELLLMVYNERFRDSLDAGEERAAQADDAVDALLAIVEPLLSAATARLENASAYQRELVFGAPSDRYRAEGLDLVRRAERALADVLDREASRRRITPRAGAATLASRSVFAAVHLHVARAEAVPADADADSAAPHDHPDDLRRQLRQIVDGFLADADADPVGAVSDES